MTSGWLKHLFLLPKVSYSPILSTKIWGVGGFTKIFLFLFMTFESLIHLELTFFLRDQFFSFSIWTAIFSSSIYWNVFLSWLTAVSVVYQIFLTCMGVYEFYILFHWLIYVYSIQHCLNFYTLYESCYLVEQVFLPFLLRSD